MCCISESIYCNKADARYHCAPATLVGHFVISQALISVSRSNAPADLTAAKVQNPHRRAAAQDLLTDEERTQYLDMSLKAASKTSQDLAHCPQTDCNGLAVHGEHRQLCYLPFVISQSLLSIISCVDLDSKSAHSLP